MTNVISLSVPQRRQTFSQNADALIDVFANHRRTSEDVFWLKENGELLNILECSGTPVKEESLAVYQQFYQQLPATMAFFAQYYRFYLSICLDLEDLGLKGNLGEQMGEWVATQGLAEAELSDLQRGEAFRLLSRRGKKIPIDTGLDDRLRQFINRSATFALPNKKAAYELTHIVFYLSEYGRRDPKLDAGAIQSLNFVGIIAYLDQNADLLAEICTALRFAGETPSQIWENWVLASLADFQVVTNSASSISDAYHEYFECSWLAATAKQDGIGQAVLGGRTQFQRGDVAAGPLRNISNLLLEMDAERSPDWEVMRPIVEREIDEEGYGILLQAQNATDDFAAFFEEFSRVNIAV
ncbi:MAG: hypothetical protein OSA49_02900 [Ascidiaceihabitans sp.]|nr:hypothetical protein [Ascidiaceihabitans sp.]